MRSFLLEFQMVLTLEVFYYSNLTLIFIESLILQNGIQNGLENGQAKILRLYTWVELDWPFRESMITTQRKLLVLPRHFKNNSNLVCCDL